MVTEVWDRESWKRNGSSLLDLKTPTDQDTVCLDDVLIIANYKKDVNRRMQDSLTGQKPPLFVQTASYTMQRLISALQHEHCQIKPQQHKPAEWVKTIWPWGVSWLKNSWWWFSWQYPVGRSPFVGGPVQYLSSLGKHTQESTLPLSIKSNLLDAALQRKSL